MPLEKPGAGDRRQCSNLRGISLLSVPGKAYTMVLLNRVKQALHQQLTEHQSGFRPRRSCADHIFALRQLFHLAHTWRRPMYCCFIDLQKAYDTVNRDALWVLLAVYGVPAKIITLLRDLHTHTTARVRLHGQLSQPFTISAGVRRGCVIAPLHY